MTVLNIVYIILANHLVHIMLNGIAITGINLVQVDRVVDVGPHVVLMLHMVFKSLWKKVFASYNKLLC